MFKSLVNIIVSGVCLLLGATATVSKQNLIAWLDQIISSFTSEDPFVYKTNGMRMPGFYHQIKCDEFTKLQSRLSEALLEWGSDCLNTRNSCGEMLLWGQGKED